MASSQVRPMRLEGEEEAAYLDPLQEAAYLDPLQGFLLLTPTRGSDSSSRTSPLFHNYDPSLRLNPSLID